MKGKTSLFSVTIKLKPCFVGYTINVDIKRLSFVLLCLCYVIPFYYIWSTIFSSDNMNDDKRYNTKDYGVL